MLNNYVLDSYTILPKTLNTSDSNFYCYQSCSVITKFSIYLLSIKCGIVIYVNSVVAPSIALLVKQLYR